MEHGGAHLLDDSDGVVLSTLPLEDECVFYGSRIKDGAPRVCLTVRALNTDYKLKVNYPALLRWPQRGSLVEERGLSVNPQ